MNLITPVEPAVLQQITTRQPARLTPGLRLSPNELSPFQVYTREELRRIGYEAAACDPARKLKGWADISRKPGERCTYTVITKDGPRQIEMDGAEASTFNLPGLPVWPKPDRLKPPSKVTWENDEDSGTVPAEEMCTEEEAQWVLDDVGPDFEIVKPSDISAKVRINTGGDKRYPWILWSKKLQRNQHFRLGTAIQSQWWRTADCAPGKWSVDDLYGLRYTLLPVAETSTLGTVPVPVPVGALPDGVVVEDHGALAGGLQVFLPASAETPGAAGDKLDQILQEVKGMRAELRELRALTGGAGVPWL